MRKPRKPISANAIGKLASQGKDVSRFFTNDGHMVYPARTVNLELPAGMLARVDKTARRLRLDRHAAITVLIQEGLEHAASISSHEVRERV